LIATAPNAVVAPRALDEQGSNFIFVHDRLRSLAVLACNAYLSRMIPRNAEPIGHISPYPRIDVSPVTTTKAEQQGSSAIDERKRRAEIERVWRLVVLAAEGN
jgi:hypothetical protein